MTFYERTKLHEGDLCRVKISIIQQGTPTKYDIQGFLEKIRHNDCIVKLQEPILMNHASVNKITVRKRYVFPARKEKSLALTETAEYICNTICKRNVQKSEKELEQQCLKCKLEHYLDILSESFD